MYLKQCMHSLSNFFTEFVNQMNILKMISNRHDRNILSLSDIFCKKKKKKKQQQKSICDLS